MIMHCRLLLPWLRVPYWFFLQSWLKNCWHGRPGIEPTTLVRCLWPTIQPKDQIYRDIPNLVTKWKKEKVSLPFNPFLLSILCLYRQLSHKHNYGEVMNLHKFIIVFLRNCPKLLIWNSLKIEWCSLDEFKTKDKC